MNIYTSYFAQIRNFPKNLVGLSTAYWNPKWLPKGKSQNGIVWLDCPMFKPGKACEGLCNGKCNPKDPDHCNFLQVYREQLDNIDVGDFLERLEWLAQQIKEGENLTEDVDFALLVYETPQNPCSERIAIQAWGASVGLDIKEWHK